IGAIRRLASDTADYVRHRLPKIYSRELVDVIFEQPYCRITNLVTARPTTAEPHRSARSREVRSACGPESRDSDFSDFGSGARAGGGVERSCGRLGGGGVERSCGRLGGGGVERSCGRLAGGGLGASRTGAGGGAAAGAGGRYRCS